ncbi:hypothetical protein PS627_00055 [Pseudomonas fluorescens]|nr:hypothetical protein PS627_00055 [Pseudomonas fluorescens]
MAPGEIPASLLATGRGIASAVVVRAQPPTALLSVRLALSFPITSRRSASAGWSWGQVFATRPPTAARRPIEWGSPSWVAGPCSGWACYFIGWFLLWCLFRPMRGAGFVSLAGVTHFVIGVLCRLACMVWRPPMRGVRQLSRGCMVDGLAWLPPAVTGTSRGHVGLCKERRVLLRASSERGNALRWSEQYETELKRSSAFNPKTY